MKIKKFLVAILVSFCMIGMWSCSEDEVVEEMTGGCGNYMDDLQEYLDAAQVYSENPTEENCEAYKAALIDFYNEYRDCPFYTEGDYQQNIEDIQSMDCSQ